jgi:hypothetical protein
MTPRDEFWKNFGLIFGICFEITFPLAIGWIVFIRTIEYFADKNSRLR